MPPWLCAYCQTATQPPSIALNQLPIAMSPTVQALTAQRDALLAELTALRAILNSKYTGPIERPCALPWVTRIEDANQEILKDYCIFRREHLVPLIEQRQELLAALREMVDTAKYARINMDSSTGDRLRHDALVRARLAIARATGEKP